MLRRIFSPHSENPKVSQELTACLDVMGNQIDDKRRSFVRKGGFYPSDQLKENEQETDAAWYDDNQSHNWNNWDNYWAYYHNYWGQDGGWGNQLNNAYQPADGGWHYTRGGTVRAGQQLYGYGGGDGGGDGGDDEKEGEGRESIATQATGGVTAAMLERILARLDALEKHLNIQKNDEEDKEEGEEGKSEAEGTEAKEDKQDEEVTTGASPDEVVNLNASNASRRRSNIPSPSPSIVVDEETGYRYEGGPRPSFLVRLADEHDSDEEKDEAKSYMPGNFLRPTGSPILDSERQKTNTQPVRPQVTSPSFRSRPPGPPPKRLATYDESTSSSDEDTSSSSEGSSSKDSDDSDDEDSDDEESDDALSSNMNASELYEAGSFEASLNSAVAAPS